MAVAVPVVFLGLHREVAVRVGKVANIGGPAIASPFLGAHLRAAGEVESPASSRAWRGAAATARKRQLGEAVRALEC